MVHQNFAKALRQALEKAGTTRIALSGQLNVSAQTVSNYTTGKNLPLRGGASRIEEILKLPVGSLQREREKDLLAARTFIKTSPEAADCKVTAEDLQFFLEIVERLGKSLPLQMFLELLQLRNL